MATQLQIRRGTTSQMNAFTGAEGELAVNTTTDTVHVHDGSTAGGHALAKADGSNIATYAGSFTTISASGAITGNVTGNLTGNVTGNVTGDVTGDLTGSVLTAAQTNITSVGTLSSLAVTGTATMDGLTVTSSSSNAGTFKAVGGYALQAYQDATSADHTALDLRSDHLSGGTNRYLIRGYNTAAGTPIESFNVNTAGGATFSGNVGIGVSAPAALLHVNDPVSGNFGGEIRVGGTGSGRVLRLFQESATDYGLYATGTSSILKFGTAGSAGVGTERARLDASGVFLLGMTSANGAGGQPSDVNGVEIGRGYINLNRDDTASVTQIQFGKNGSRAGRIVTTTTTSYLETSDRRVKSSIADADDCGTAIDSMQVRKFDWVDSGVHHPFGMIAQELLEIAPIAVHAPEDSEEMMGIDYSKLVPMLVKEIQSLRSRVAELENN